MNKITEKVMPIMNHEELETLILSHYEGESQTLTSGARITSYNVCYTKLLRSACAADEI